MDRLASGLWVPPSFHVNRMRRTVRTVTLPGRGRAKVTVDDSGTTTHIESSDRLDAIVRPAAVRMALRRIG